MRYMGGVLEVVHSCLKDQVQACRALCGTDCAAGVGTRRRPAERRGPRVTGACTTTGQRRSAALGGSRCGCAEGVLATAILAARHADVWDAAALLLREHCGCAYRSRGPWVNEVFQLLG